MFQQCVIAVSINNLLNIMKILFIENRLRTYFWEIIANKLKKEDGHEVAFIVQNHDFEPRNFVNYVIPYPQEFKENEISDEDKVLIKSDRALNYFKLNTANHYPYYRKNISLILDDFLPDLVFGECTAFHELITIDECKKRDIKFLHPSTCRFPTGRFSFYKYDTLEPFRGSGEILSPDLAGKVISSIVKRSIVPDYMKKPASSIVKKLGRIRDLVLLSKSYYSGEHYNTPSPFVKKDIESLKNSLIGKWDVLASEKSGLIEQSSFRLLYPMHMQPEANLDVWGRPYRNQLETIKSIIDNAPEDVVVVVKPNPKSKYEITDELITYIKETPRVIPLGHSVPMSKVLQGIDMVVTITGTIAIECILSNIPVVTMINTINNQAGNCLYLSSFRGLPDVIKSVKENVYPRLGESKKIEFINMLNQTSYYGMPYSKISDENVENVMTAFRDVIENG